MGGIPSSTTGSDRPGWGLGFAALLLLGLRLLHPAAQGTPVPGDPSPPPPPFTADFSSLKTPDVLLAGDSRVFQLRFGDFARTFAPDGPPPGGRVWGEGGGSVPDMLAYLEASGVRPRVLVLGASPLSMALAHFSRAAPAGGATGVTRWKSRVRHALLAPWTFLPQERGPSAVARLLQGRVHSEAVSRIESVWDDAPPPNMPGYRWYFEAEPVPSERVVRDTVSGIRRAQAAGTRVVLARLPIGPAMSALENGWGAEGVLRRIARDSGAPLIDLNADPAYPALRDAILDESHVYGDEPCRLLSEALGRRSREALDP